MDLYSGNQTFDYKLRNFPEESYNTSPDTRLYRFLYALLGEAGAGSLRKLQAITRLGAELYGTRFTDLDSLFGSFLRFDRLSGEMYSFDPFSQPLTTDEWDEVFRKDNQYRQRIKLFMQSLVRGGTNEGIAMAAEAACGHECQVLEVWRNSASLGLAGTTGRTNTPREFIVVPKTTTLDPERRRAIYRAIERLKPANTICTVDENGLAFHSIISIRKVFSPTEYFEIRKYVTGVDVPPAPPEARYFWIKDGVEVEEPTYAHLKAQEEQWSLNETITSVASFKFDSGLTIYSELPQGVGNQPPKWGPWREIERVDSPDNFPLGKYPNDQNKYNAAGVYVFAWASQAAYETWLTCIITSLEGERSGNRYRLPQTLDITPGPTSAPEDSLAPTVISVLSPYYAGASQ